MSAPDTSWQRVPPPLVRAVLAHAPLDVVVLGGDPLRVEAGSLEVLGLSADGAAPAGAPLRAQLAERLGEAGLRALDGVRRGEGACRLRSRPSRELWVERLDAERVAIYAPRGDTASQSLRHALRNALFGIRAAAELLLARDDEPGRRTVLAAIRTAADEATLVLDGAESVP